MGRKFGYARVSTSQQCLDIQTKALLKVGIEEHRIMTDKSSGNDMEREGLKLLLIKVEKGDMVYITRLDRLGRNTLEMCQLIDTFEKKGIGVRFLDEGLNTDGPMGKVIITLLTCLAEAERKRTMERVAEGQAEARAKGVKFGPKFKIDRKKLLELRKQRYGATEIARILKINRQSIYRILKEEKEKNEIEKK